MLSDEPRFHGPTVESLWAAARRNRLPHALLVEGIEGIGKFRAAKWLATGLLCAEGPGVPCGRCGPCKRVRSGTHRGNHPDFYVLDPVEEELSIIRVSRIAYRPDAIDVPDPEDCIEHFLGLRAMEGRGRVVLIRECHRMNPAAQNALLKTLEEPRPGVLLVLETHRADSLLSTILSRCVRLHLDPLPAGDCRGILEENGVSGAEAESLARWAEGSPGRALGMHARSVGEMRARLGEILRGSAGPHAVAAELLELDGEFSGDKPLARLRDRARTFLELALAVLRDLRRHEAGVECARLPHGGLIEGLREAGGLPRGLELSGLVELGLECLADVGRNVNPEALLERVLLGLAGAASAPSPDPGPSHVSSAPAP